MKALKAGLLDNVVSSYDQTKTTIQGRVNSKLVSGTTALGPPLNVFVDTVADTAGTTIPVLSYLSPNGRIFSIGAEAAGVSFISLHNFDLTTGAKTFVGQIRFSLPDTAATIHVLRGLKVVDTGTTGWKIFVATTGSVLINGGLFMANSIDLADFIPVGSTLIPFATGNNQKAVYALHDPANIGAGQLHTIANGLIVDTANTLVYAHNGASPNHQYYLYNYSISPTWTSSAITGASSTDVISHAGHSFVNGTPIVFTSLTGGTGLVAGTVYFVVNANAGVDYQVSATSGGAAINFTTDITTGTVGRAFGTTGSNFVHKTGNLPATTGAILTTDSEDYAVPGHTANAGFPCAFFATVSTLYLGKLSELTAGTTTWPSLVSANMIGTVNQVTAVSATLATWSNILDKAVYITNANLLIMKQMVNNSIDKIFGTNTNTYRETFPASETQGFRFSAASALDIEAGWVLVTGSLTGQRGNVIHDLRSDATFDYSYIVTKVLDTPLATYKFLNSWRQLAKDTGTFKVQYRTSGFGSISGGWADIAYAADLTAIAAGNQIQFKILFDTLTIGPSIHAQIVELFLGYESNVGISDNWEFSDDFSDNTSPSRITFRLKKAYVGAVPTLYFRAYDLSDALLVNHNTSADIAHFEYSTTNGVSWVPMGTIPNTVGTLVRYTFTSPPGVDIRPGIKES